MSLSIEIGCLAFQIENGDDDSVRSVRRDFENINSVLTESGLPCHNEPEQLPALINRARAKSFSYSVIHHLRRAYAYYLDDPDAEIEYMGEFDGPEDDIILDLEIDNMRSHLVSHSDREGYYVPVAFTQVLHDSTEEDRIVGFELGSSFKLREELLEIAPKIGINLANDQLSDRQAHAVNESVEKQEEFHNEKMAWILLWESCRLSIAHHTAIMFC